MKRLSHLGLLMQKFKFEEAVHISIFYSYLISDITSEKEPLFFGNYCICNFIVLPLYD